MAELFVIRGECAYDVESRVRPSFVYRIGSAVSMGPNVIELNDVTLLHQYALQLRDVYTKWICEFNVSFLDHGLRKDDLSLFYLTDLSCMRTELFDTYNAICNLLVIKEKLQGEEIDQATLIGLDPSFRVAFLSIFPKAQLVVVNELKIETSHWKYLILDIRLLVGSLRLEGEEQANLFPGPAEFHRWHSRLWVLVCPSIVGVK